MSVRKVLFVAICALAIARSSLAQDASLASVSDLVKEASHLQATTARTSLGTATAADFRKGELFEAGHVPGYQRALSLIPAASGSFGTAFHAFLYGGTIDPETKMAMGL